MFEDRCTSEIITSKTIARYIAVNFKDEGGILVVDSKVYDLIPEIQFKNNYKFVNRNASVYDAHCLFMNQIRNHKLNLDVVFITNSGKSIEMRSLLE